MVVSPVNSIPETPPHTPIQEIPETPHILWASRDCHQKILLITNLGYSQHSIASYLGTTQHVVQYTQQVKQATPQKPRGRHPKISRDQVDKIIEFISILKQNRQIPYYRLIDILYLDISCHSLRNALSRKGYQCYIAL